MDSPTADIAVRCSDVTKRFGHGEAEVIALDHVSLQVRSGSFVAVMGPSGSGKSTLMHVLAGLDGIDHGEIWLADQPLTQLNDNDLTRLRRDQVGFIFQAFNLLPMLTAKQNILVPLTFANQTVDTQWFDTVITNLGLHDRLHHKPSALSGGQQQRVAIARALITRPAVIFADEPTGNLDSASSTSTLELLRTCVTELGQTVIMVTHDPNAATYADEVVVLADGQIRQTLVRPTVDQLLASMAAVDSATHDRGTTNTSAQVQS